MCGCNDKCSGYCECLCHVRETLDDPTKAPKRRETLGTCNYHYESGGKCNNDAVALDVYLDKLCDYHVNFVKRERDQFTSLSDKAEKREGVYIAGPMSGFADYNYPAFYAAEGRIQQVYGNAYRVLNPARHFNGRTDLPREMYLRSAVKTVVDAEVVVVLPGWENSPGAILEVEIARQTGIPVYELDVFCDSLEEMEPLNWPESVIKPLNRFTAPDVYTQAMKDPAVKRLWESHGHPDQKCEYGERQGQFVTCTYAWAVKNLPESMMQKVDFDDSPEEKVYDLDRVTQSVPPRADILREAADLISGDRNNSYGPPTQDFSRSAGAASAYGYRRLVFSEDGTETLVPIVASDIALLINLVKISRLMHSRAKRDNWTDMAGYAGCGYECALEEE